MLVYVYDIIITSRSGQAISNLIAKLNAKFPLKNLGKLHHFLGLEVQPASNGGLQLSQTKYISNLLTKTNMSNARPIKTMFAPSTKLLAIGTDQAQDPQLYRFVIGALQILRYLNGTIDYCLHFNKTNDLNISAFCDSDWAFYPNDLRSTSGYYVHLGNNIVSWTTQKQKVVSKFSTEAEFRSLSTVASEIAYIQKVLFKLQIPITRVPQIWCDNQGVVLLYANPVLHRKNKHFELDLWYIREKVARGELIVKHVLAHFQVADLLTKAPSSSAFLELRPKLNVKQKSTLSLQGDNKEKDQNHNSVRILGT
uniref:Reverse transcriptase Ty1/copia-type domain-containing protein n=1 Tax=Cajanus cajan TaxID=3821 RepID=A0A151U8F6_CAJCA|nr:hypothetical protein KK1_019807 [Cajanus cajan]